MKATCYLRIAKTSRGYTFNATTKPAHEPLRDVRGDGLPTVAVKVTLDLPANTFDAILAEFEGEIPESKLEVLGLEVGDFNAAT